jgi:hypothetical protein
MQLSANKVEHYLKHNLSEVLKKQKNQGEGRTGSNYEKLQNFSEQLG